MAVFSDLSMRRFEHELLAHMACQAPEHCRAIGDDLASQTIRLGVARASVYGLTNRGPVRTYIELMFLLGSYFDTDPQYPWATATLLRDDLPDQMDRAGRLFDAATGYFDAVLGEAGRSALRALRMLAERVRDPPVIRASRIVDDLLENFCAVYPEKCAWLGDGPLVGLIEASLTASAKLAFNATRERALVAALMFGLGHQCFDDPLFPWISHTLEDPRISTPTARAVRLERRMMAYARHVLSSAED